MIVFYYKLQSMEISPFHVCSAFLFIEKTNNPALMFKIQQSLQMNALPKGNRYLSTMADGFPLPAQLFFPL